jgi:hypothetical protein
MKSRSKIHLPTPLRLRILEQAWQLLCIYKVFWPPDYTINFGEAAYMLSQIDLNPPPKTSQTTLVTVDYAKRSDHTRGQRAELA